MGAKLIDLRLARDPVSDELTGLDTHLSPLVGEPFRFVRVSYGDELTLHFGDLKPSRFPKLKNKMYGSYILGLCASPWVLKSGSEFVVVDAGVLGDPFTTSLGMPLSKVELESRPLIVPESRVLSATPLVVKSIPAIGLQVRFSDGSTLLVLPTIQEPDEPEDEGLPPLADWELLSPGGDLKAGPGLEWSFEPSGVAAPDQQG